MEISRKEHLYLNLDSNNNKTNDQFVSLSPLFFGQ